ncbi:hypothetical protein NEHOM01_1650 [Nematocida homosporus]|uniref:uncharacterized protein n=1 Tax=Nematocida homosporus TaxID=1912981 RepID=UPI00221E5FE8|nr:uncharacterized protein NEHOM01_1650 [Nematocida homosporus]KAI5186711.1 hypothetical protein NEHOM01_1650 [Nematocida homosporus]
MSLKLLLVWLCCVMVWFGLVLGSAIGSPNLSATMDQEVSNASTGLPCLTANGQLSPEQDLTMSSSTYTATSDDPTDAAPNTNPMRDRILSCLEALGLIKLFKKVEWIEHTNPNNSPTWELKLVQLEGRLEKLERQNVITTAHEVAEIRNKASSGANLQFPQTVGLEYDFCFIPSTLGSDGTNAGTKQISYKQYLEDLKPLKKIICPLKLVISGESNGTEILDQLELLLFLLRVMDASEVDINWTDDSMTRFSTESKNRLISLLNSIAEVMMGRKLVFKVITRPGNTAVWNDFRVLFEKDHTIDLVFVESALEESDTNDST